MRAAVLLVLLVTLAACRSQPATVSSGGGADASTPSRGATASPPAAADAARESLFPLRIEGTRFVDAQGRPFAWRGITSFRLAEMIARGRERDAVAYLDWAASQRLSVLRVLLMAHHLFQLSPAEGRAALPRLLDLAKARGLAVEVVALADTASMPSLEYEAHIDEIGRIAGEKGNALVEIANEPGHPTQARRVHDAAALKALAARLPEALLVALGSLEYGLGYADGDYATTHVPRGERDWDHVLAVADGADAAARLRKPLVSDEPIGAAPEHQPGRRDNSPERFAAAAALTRFAGMEGTFHYEGGLHSRVPSEIEAACLDAWREGLELVGDLPLDSRFVAAAAANAAAVEGARAAYARVTSGRVWYLLIDPGPSAAVRVREGWKESARRATRGAQLVVVERAQ